MQSYILGIYHFFDLLVIYNKKFIRNSENNIRISLNEIEECDELLNNLFKTIHDENNLEKIIEITLNTIGLIWYYQPFNDGNTRTLKLFLKYIFNTLEYDLNLTIKSERPIIPITTFEGDKCIPEDIQNIKKLLRKKES